MNDEETEMFGNKINEKLITLPGLFELVAVHIFIDAVLPPVQ